MVHKKYIEAAARMQQLKEVERVCRDSTVYDPQVTMMTNPLLTVVYMYPPPRYYNPPTGCDPPLSFYIHTPLLILHTYPPFSFYIHTPLLFLHTPPPPLL